MEAWGRWERQIKVKMRRKERRIREIQIELREEATQLVWSLAKTPPPETDRRRESFQLIHQKQQTERDANSCLIRGEQEMEGRQQQ